LTAIKIAGCPCFIPPTTIGCSPTTGGLW
jgi:hypothetical protein